jgi:uroporphyrinogen-III synthase
MPAGALSGFTVAVTADRRRDELATLLERDGARVVLAPALRMIPLSDDTELRAATLSLVERPPDVVVASTGVGLRGWFEAAEGWGIGDALRASLSGSHIVAGGSRARSTLRAAGLCAAWSPQAEGWDETLDYLLGPADRPGAGPDTGARSDGVLAGGVAGRRVAVQLHGEPQPEFCTALRAAGAIVVEVPVYRWGPPLDTAPLRRLVDLILAPLVDAVTFTSAMAVGSLLRIAGADSEAVLDRLRTTVLAACVGPVSAAALRDKGVPAVAPEQARLGALVSRLGEELPRRAPTLKVAGAAVTLRGHAAVVDGALRPLAPGPMAVLRALAASPGRVLSRSALLRALPRGADEHAVEMAVARLRAALGGSAYVQTVVKRGYRLRVD